ncbi:MobP2 family relaxase [Peribacillus butanolivorans]|uniref:MobP2 family relaxase n=1 Tax=Peribacillus butanolivorans TaxID=421767 RepID=UPI0037C9DEF7
MGKPGIILTSQFTTPNAKSFSNYVKYMTRKEALNERVSSLTIEEKRELDKINQVVEHYDMKKGNSYLSEGYEKQLSEKEEEAKKIIKSKEMFNNDTDYLKYISYMSRQYALEKKIDLTDTEKKELEVVKKRADRFDTANENHREYDRSIKDGVFSINKEKMNVGDILEVNEIIKNAQNNGSVFYQDVISFDTEFLVKEKLYDPVTNELDEKRIKHASQKMMDKMFEDEDIQSGYWFASIHRNTAHIHIHFGTVETKNTRPLITVEEEGGQYLAPKGKRKQKTIDNMKSVFANSLVDRTVELSRISFLRNTLVQDIKVTYQQKDKLMQKTLLEGLYEELPSNKKYWQYGSKYISDNTRDKIDKTTDSLMKDNPNYKEYFERREEESNYRKNVFGDSERSEKEYAINKKKDIQKRLGNSLLKELKSSSDSLNHNRSTYNEIKEYPYNKDQNNVIQKGNNITKISLNFKNCGQKEYDDTKEFPNTRDQNNGDSNDYISKKHHKPIMSYKDINRLKRAINDDFDKYRAEKDYEQMQQRISWEQQRNRL